VLNAWWLLAIIPACLALGAAAVAGVLGALFWEKD
jgi:hypothetical protein